MKRSVIGFVAVAAFAAASLVVPASAGGVQPEPSPAQQCVVPSGLRGQPVQVARTQLARSGCRNIVVRARCEDVSQFGLVVDVRPGPGRYPASKRVTLWKGIRQTADGQTCGELPDSDADQGSTPGVSVYDGLYHGQFAISGSTSPSMANAGPYTLTFTVSGGRISGDIDGTVSGNGLAAEIVSVEGLPCRAPNGLQFTQQGTVSGAVECSLGATTVWGNVTGNR